MLASRLAHPVQLLRMLSAPRVEDDLTALANRYGSDKGTTAFARHAYTRIYSLLFSPLRQRNLRILELGLLHVSNAAWGASHGGRGGDAPSLRIWRDYFPNATLFGFDIADFSAVRIPGCEVLRGDAGSRTDLAALVATTGGRFDIVIDDASHASSHQQIALATLFPHVVPGGLYIVEDLHWQPKHLDTPDVPKTVDLLRRLEVGMTIASPAITPDERDYIVAHARSVRLFDSAAGRGDCRDALAIIEKR